MFTIPPIDTDIITKCFMLAWDEFGDDKSTEFLVEITANRLNIEPEKVYAALADTAERGKR
jgi:hypothetical protein